MQESVLDDERRTSSSNNPILNPLATSSSATYWFLQDLWSRSIHKVFSLFWSGSVDSFVQAACPKTSFCSDSALELWNFLTPSKKICSSFLSTVLPCDLGYLGLSKRWNVQIEICMCSWIVIPPYSG
jgi:hypothetical protein